MVYQFESSKEGCTTTGAPSGTAAAPGPSNGLPRPQSSLELLSQTAAVLEHSPVLTYSSSTSLVSVHSGDLNNTNQAAASSNVYSAGGSSPKEARGVTPTESSMSPQKYVPSLPDMSSKHHHQQQKKKQSEFLELKPTSFLPAPLLSDGIPGDSSEGRAGTPLYYSPGLFLTYSNGSTGGGGAGQPQPYHQAAPPVTTTTTGSEDAVVPNFLTSHGSFTSSGSLASAPSFAFAPTTMTNGAVSLASSSIAPAAAFAPPPPTQQQQQQQARGSFDNITVTAAEEQQQQRENYFLRQQLAAKDTTIESLQKQVETLQQEIRELRQLPTGKISQIPVEDMLSLMREYGSEVSDTAMPPRKQHVQKASVVRQFRRWNPNFLEWFEFRNSQWVPKLGREGELRRREEARNLKAQEREKWKSQKVGS